jgi:hypothetical protein
MKLPPIFAKNRFSIPKDKQPPVIIRLELADVENAIKYIREAPDDQNLNLKIWPHLWLEGPHVGMLVINHDENSSTVYCWTYRHKKPTKHLFNEDINQDGDKLFKVTKAMFYQGMVALHLLTEEEAEVSVNTKTRNKPRFWLKEKDGIRYAPISSLASMSGQSAQRGYVPPDQPSGIKMREHDVRGHWRTYSSGIRVWVRSHKRGDPELGRVTRVIGSIRNGSMSGL